MVITAILIMAVIIATHSHRLMMYMLFTDYTHETIYKPSSKECIMYFHGLGQANDPHLSTVSNKAVKWFVYSNTPLEDLKARAVAEYDELVDTYGQGCVSVYGLSLGAYLATHVASVRPVPVLMLEVPMTSLEQCVRKMLGAASMMVPGRPHAGTMEIIPMFRNVRSPIYVFDSSTDEVVHYEERYPPGVHRVTVKTSHNTARLTPEWLQWFHSANQAGESSRIVTADPLKSAPGID